MVALVAGVVGLSACGNAELEDLAGGQGRPIVLSGRVEEAAISRVDEQGFQDGDVMGVYITDYEGDKASPLAETGNRATNMPFTYDEAANRWEGAHEVYWKDGTTAVDVYGYYPYAYPEGVRDYAFEVQRDQSGTTGEGGMGGYEASDFLWASTKEVAASNEPVTLTFSHRMSKLVVQMEKGESYDGNLPEDARVYVHNTVPDATIDLSVGLVTKNPYASARTIEAKKVNTGMYTAIVVPQRLDNQVPLVEIVTEGVSYLVERKFVFKQGIQHTMTITLEQNPEQIKIDIGGEIEVWDETDEKV